jgi:rhodanese-related sulfurtransferase
LQGNFSFTIHHSPFTIHHSPFTILEAMFGNLFGKKKYESLETRAFKEALAAHPDAIILDVRTQEEYDAGHLEGARKLDFLNGQFSREVASLDPEKPYFIYCRSGGRSSAACGQLAQAGFKKVFNLQGGYMSWK